MLLQYISWTEHTLHIGSLLYGMVCTVLPMLQMLSTAYLHLSALQPVGCGWVAGLSETKANSAFKLSLT